MLMVKNCERRIDSTGGWQVLVAQPNERKQLVSMQGLHFGDKILLEKFLSLYFSEVKNKTNSIAGAAQSCYTCKYSKWQ